MSDALVVAAVLVAVPLVFGLAMLAGYFEDHPHPLREYRLWHGLLESCPRCNAEVPFGWISYRKARFDGLFGLQFEDQIDGSYMMNGFGVWYGGGRSCSICDTHWPYGKSKSLRPKLFAYGRNPDFRLARNV